MSETAGDLLCLLRTPMTMVHDADDGVRWCFACRTRREFRYQVHATVEPSYYDPSPSIRCGVCGLIDGDVFPGRVREWGE